jgi:peptidoglycan/LPS O-acetylase OafA/YrhL
VRSESGPSSARHPDRDGSGSLERGLREPVQDLPTVVDSREVRGRRADIQGLRAVAVLLVVAFHAGLAISGGFIGVDVFFVISGFVIGGLLVAELERNNQLDFAAFYARRVRRILPALALLIVAVAVVGVALLNPLVGQRQTASAGAAAATFVGNLFFYRAKSGYFDPTITTNPLLHTWSLAVEEQFYLFFPLLLAFAWGFAGRSASPRSRRSVATTMVGLGIVASFLISYLSTHGELVAKPAQFAFYSAPARAWEFGIGVLVVLVLPRLARLRAGIGPALGVFGAALVAVGAVRITSTTPFPGTAALLPVLGTALLLIAGTISNGGVSWLLSTRPAVWIGDRSYGWYLWHWPAIVFAEIVWPHSSAALVVAGVGSLAPTMLSYRLIEQPIRFDTSITGRRALRVAIVCILVPVLVCFGLGFSARKISERPTIRRVAHQARPHADTVQHCDSERPIGKRRSKCTRRAIGERRGTAWLLGDSNAGHITEPVERAATGEGLDFTVATNSLCPFVDLVLVVDGSTQSTCRQFVVQSLKTLVRGRPTVVVLAASSTDYINNNRFRLRDPHTNKVARTRAAKAAMWSTGLARVLERFADAGTHTIVVNTAPHFANWALTECPAFRLYRGERRCGESRPLSAVRREQEAARRAEDAAVAIASRSVDIDFTDALCPLGVCATNRGAFFVFRDGAHLSVDGALTLVPLFDQLIKSAVASSAQ